ncbi:MAG TPA: Asp23/Gls24 family envelope stress response protein [Solirubrobacteraceae bacterium]|nr:Asp23/Gls24 family envelope stress response protein [Solirubrobacteraceae bacterium]
MAETTGPTTRATPPTPEASAAGTGRLETERGTTTIAEIVVTKVAGIAAREVAGVHRLGSAVSRAFGAVTQRLQVSDGSTQGVNVEVTETDARVSMSVVIDYGESIPEVAQAIRDNVVRRIEATTGLHCAAVDIAVTDLYFPGDDDEPVAPAA